MEESCKSFPSMILQTVIYRAVLELYYVSLLLGSTNHAAPLKRSVWNSTWHVQKLSKTQNPVQTAQSIQ